MTARPDMPAVAAMLAQHMDRLAVELVGTRPTGRSRDELRFRTRGSLAVIIAGPKRGTWHDYQAGQSGDAVAFVAHLRGTSQRDAWEWALGWLGIDQSAPMPTPRQEPVAPPQEAREPTPSRTLDLARAAWREALPAAGTPVETYLRARGLELPADAPLRFHPACPRGTERLPAMVALMTDPSTGEPCGVHRTFLAVDGSGKAPGQAKMMAGHAGVVRLVPDEDVTLGLGLAEGIETALAVMQRTGWRPVWAATSAGGIRTFPVLAGIEELTLFADADDRGAGLTAAIACAERWNSVARRARVLSAPRGHDFHDALVGAA